MSLLLPGGILNFGRDSDSREFSYEKDFYFKNLKDSETLTDMTYEIELEFIGNKDKTLFEGKSSGR